MHDPMEKSLVSKVSISTIANLFVMVVSVFTTLVFPKFLSLEAYSYWQLYVLYIGFVTILGLGLVEGVYLINGGKKFNSLDSSTSSFNTYFLAGLVSILFGLVFVVALFFVKDAKYLTLIAFVCVEGVLYNVRMLPLYVLQATDRINEYALTIFIDRFVFLLISFILVICKVKEVEYFMLADICGCIASGIYSFIVCRSKFLGKPCEFKRGIKSVRSNINVGFKLMFAQMSGVAILGVIKLGIKTGWSLLEFGQIALTITCVNIFLKFASAIGNVLFPTVCNFDEEKLKTFYHKLNFSIEAIVMTLMIFYYPARLLLSWYLPAYSEGFRYMDFLLPICLFETKVSLVLNTYYKALRKEKVLMYVNVADMLFSIVSTLLVVFLIKDLTVCASLIVIALGLRCFVLERLLVNKYLAKKRWNSGFFTLMIAGVFIICNAVIGGWIGAAVYLLFVAVVMIINREDVKDLKRTIFMRKKSEKIDNRTMAIVFGQEHANTLGIIRSLGESGSVRIIAVIGNNKLKFASKSKYINDLFEFNEIEEGLNLIIDKFSGQTKKPYIFVTDDVIASLIDLNYDKLKNDFIVFNAGQQGRITYLMNKKVQAELAESVGLTCIKTTEICPSNFTEFDKISYPVFIKCEDSLKYGWKKNAKICETEQELKTALEESTCDKLLMQPYIIKKNEMGLQGVSLNHGEDIIICGNIMYNYLLPNSYSPYQTLYNFDDEAMLKKINALLESMGYEGLFEIEFIVDEIDNKYFCEVNFRSSAWNYSTTAAGMSMPNMWIDFNEDSSKISLYNKPQIPDNFTVMSEFNDLKTRVLNGKGKDYGISFGKWLKEKRKTNCLYFKNKKDMRPYRAYIFGSLKSRIFKKKGD